MVFVDETLPRDQLQMFMTDKIKFVQVKDWGAYNIVSGRFSLIHTYLHWLAALPLCTGSSGDSNSERLTAQQLKDR